MSLQNFTLVAISVLLALPSASQCEQTNMQFETSDICEPCIDTLLNPNNIWHIGNPQKNIFQGGWNSLGALVTDTVLSYPINDSSSFVIKHIASPDIQFGGANFSGLYYCNTDSINDYGVMELSCDQGATWTDMINDPEETFSWQGVAGAPTFTGNTNGWKTFNVDLSGVCWPEIQGGDIVMIKFTFYSDGINDGLDGIMFDHIDITEYTISDDIEHQEKSSTVFPNPTSGNLKINYSGSSNEIHHVKIYSNKGQIQQSNFRLIDNGVNVDVGALVSGGYFYQVIDDLGRVLSTGRFVVENQR